MKKLSNCHYYEICHSVLERALWTLECVDPESRLETIWIQDQVQDDSLTAHYARKETDQ